MASCQQKNAHMISWQRLVYFTITTGFDIRFRHPGNTKEWSHDFHKILHYNVEGINSQIYGNKLENDHFLKPILGRDIIAFCGSQCSEETLISLPGYFPVSVCVKQHIWGIVKQLPSLSNGIMWLRLNGDMLNVKHDIAVGIVNISPNNFMYTIGHYRTRLGCCWGRNIAIFW